MDLTQFSKPINKGRNHRSYAVREWSCIDGELTCSRVYVPCEGREGPESFGQPDLLRPSFAVLCPPEYSFGELKS
jgi:hypothetical protein